MVGIEQVFLCLGTSLCATVFIKRLSLSEVLLYTDSTEPTLDTDTKRTTFCKTAESLKEKKALY